MADLCLKPLFLQETVLGTPSELDKFLAEVERSAFRQAMYAVRNEESALDIVQDAMLRLAEKYARQPATEWPMLFQRILQNAIRDYFRRQKVRSFWSTLLSAFQKQDSDVDVSDPLEWVPHNAESPASPETELTQARTMKLIEEGLANLPARQREAFILRYWEDHDVAETAAIMACSEGSVKTHSSRACHSLAKWLKERGIES